ncbi:MAG: hypothetical protein ABIS26_00715 [Candidatus Paceibacterota bacterium]
MEEHKTVKTKAKINIEKNKGFVILFAVTLASILLAIALGVSSVALNEARFGTSTKDTNNAFVAADTGAECALFYDKFSTKNFPIDGVGRTASVTCAGVSNTVSYTQDTNKVTYSYFIPTLGSSSTGCAKVTIFKDNTVSPMKVTVTSTGYNIYDAGGSNCDSTNKNRVARELIVTSLAASPLPPANWIIRTTPAKNMRAVTYGNGLFVAVNGYCQENGTSGGTGSCIETSPDGITWTQRTVPEYSNEVYLSAVAYGAGIFVATQDVGYVQHLFTSPDGITWTSRPGAAFNYVRDIVYANGKFVAVTSPENNSGFNYAWTSTDGINWSSQSTPSGTDNQWTGIAYGNGTYVAVGCGIATQSSYACNSNAGNRVMTSPNGITWTLRADAADNMWQSITYGNGLFVAVASSGTGNRVMTSPDGITWTLRTSAADKAWYDVTYGNGTFVAVASSSTTDSVMTSPDGINWTIGTSAEAIGWKSVTYGNGTFVATSAYNPQPVDPTHHVMTLTSP